MCLFAAYATRNTNRRRRMFFEGDAFVCRAGGTGEPFTTGRKNVGGHNNVPTKTPATFSEKRFRMTNRTKRYE